MNTNNIKTKTISIGEFKIYPEGGTLKVKRDGEIFNLLEEKESVRKCRFFSTKDSEVLIFIRKLFKAGNHGP